MNPRSASVETIFLEAIEKEASLERAAFVEATCGTDHRLRRRVEALLRAHDQAGDFLSTPLPERELSFSLEDPVGRTPGAGPWTKYLLKHLGPARREGCLGTLGPYEVTGILGSGGMSVVFQAFDPRLNRVVALKVLTPELVADDIARQRFLREAQAAAALKHENITAIHTIEDADPIPYLVMEFVDGESLQHLLEQGDPLSVSDIVQIGRQMAAGLAAAHAQGLIHRDIKPANVLVERRASSLACPDEEDKQGCLSYEARVKITDFGLARTVNEPRLTHSGLLAGTPRFMSPEQTQGQPVDPRSDLFSLGSVLYTLCAGQTPFQAETTLGTLRRICDDTPTPLGETRPDIPGWLVEVIDRLMEKDPARRFQSAAEVEEILKRQEHPGKLRRIRRQWSGRLVFIAAVVALVATTAMLWAARSGWLRPGDNPLDPGTALTTDGTDRPSGIVSPPQLLSEVRRISTADKLAGLALSPPGDVVYVAGTSGIIHAFHVWSGKSVGRFQAGKGIRDLAISRHGTRLAACADMSVLIWDVASGNLLNTILVGPPPERVAFSPDGRQIAVCVYGGPGAAATTPRGFPGRIVNFHGVTVYEVDTGKIVGSLLSGTENWIHCIDWSGDGKRIAAGTEASKVFVWDPTIRGRPTRKLVFHWDEQAGPIHTVHFSRDGTRLFLSGRNGFRCRSLADGQLMSHRDFKDPVLRFALSFDETWLAVSGSSEVLLYRTNQSDRSMFKLQGQEGSLKDFAFLPDNQHLVTSSDDGTIRVWQLPLR